MNENYQQSLTWVLEHEGGYTNHPADPGGPTNFGIILTVLAAWRKKAVTAEDVRNMTLKEAADIYKARYWDPMKGDALPGGVDYAGFDFGVNSGITRSMKYIQAIVGVEPDGKIGRVTLDAIDRYPDKKRLAALLCDRRLSFLMGLKTWKVFGRGWGRRVANVKARAMKMAG